MTKIILNRIWVRLPTLWLSCLVMAAGIIDARAEADPVFDGRAYYAETLLGSYLAGRIAKGVRDNESAARFYGKALSGDPENEVLQKQSFVLEASRGNWGKALPLARSVTDRDKNQRLAQMALGIQAFRAGNFKKAATHFNFSAKSPIAQLTSTLANAWILQARGRTNSALKALDKLNSISWAQFYQSYHRGLIADMAGRRKLAGSNFKALFKRDPRTLRVALAYARHLAIGGQKKQARNVLKKHLKATSGRSLPKALLAKLEQGYRPARFLNSPQDGLAEVFFGIGDALTGEGGIDVGIVYLQMALYLRGDFPMAQLAIGEVYEDTKRYALSNRAYDRIRRSSPLLTTVTIRKAFNLNSLKKIDEAKKILDEIILKQPKNLRALEAAGNIMRAHKRYEEALGYYTRAIALIDKPVKNDWKYFYARGVCYERLKKWRKAEADLLKANELNPEQPLVLNYLGYSWVDQNLNLDRAMALIRKAVERKPEDGYFVDSLGWAHYRLGNYKKATKQLERAVELRSDDPVINHHLGDAYWRVGRRYEARFQWNQALTLKPEPEEAEKIRQKLKFGLDKLPKKKYAVVPQASGKMNDAVKSSITEKKMENPAGDNAGSDDKPYKINKPADEESRISPDVRLHQVKSGESLWDISRKYFGNGSYYEDIIRANQNQIKKTKDLRPGMKLIIPFRR